MSDHDETVDQNFNDAELQDIMNEIESLEKEFNEQEASEEPAAQFEEDNVQDYSEEITEDEIEAQTTESVEASSDSFDESYDEEMEAPAAEAEFTEEDSAIEAEAEFTDEDFEDSTSMEDATETVEEASNVVSMSSHRAQTTSAPTGEMSFSGHGQMDFNMNFQLGSQEASLTVQDGKLVVSVAGVELSLSEEGCDVEMAGGVRFSVPLEAGAKSSSKKAA